MDRFLLRLDRQEPYISLHFIMIFVRDQERSLRFYVDHPVTNSSPAHSA